MSLSDVISGDAIEGSGDCKIEINGNNLHESFDSKLSLARFATKAIKKKPLSQLQLVMIMNKIKVFFN